MREGMFRAAVAGAMLAMGAPAQAPGIPDTYSFLASSAMVGSMTLKVNRNGSKELVEMTGTSGSLRLRQLYDFQAHKVYSLDLNVNRCTAQDYVSPYAPMTQDPIGGSAEVIKGAGALPVVRTENVNGIAAKVVEAALPEGQGKYILWLEQKSGFPVKQALVMGNQPEKPIFEIRQLSYAPSPASLFTPPAECTRVAGVSSATGGHAETEVSVTVPAQTHQLGGSGTAAAPATARPGAGGRVTAVRLRLVPESYAGACPSRVQLVGEITTNGPGTVHYQFLAGAVRKLGPAEGTISFRNAGTQTITLDSEYVMTPRVPNASLLAIMLDAQGRRGPQNVSSGPVKYNAACTGRAPAARK